MVKLWKLWSTWIKFWHRRTFTRNLNCMHAGRKINFTKVHVSQKNANTKRPIDQFYKLSSLYRDQVLVLVPVMQQIHQMFWSIERPSRTTVLACDTRTTFISVNVLIFDVLVKFVFTDVRGSVYLWSFAAWCWTGHNAPLVGLENGQLLRSRLHDYFGNLNSEMETLWLSAAASSKMEPIYRTKAWEVRMLALFHSFVSL